MYGSQKVLVTKCPTNSTVTQQTVCSRLGTQKRVQLSGKTGKRTYTITVGKLWAPSLDLLRGHRRYPPLQADLAELGERSTVAQQTNITTAATTAAATNITAATTAADDTAALLLLTIVCVHQLVK